MASELTAARSVVERLFRGAQDFFHLTTNPEDDEHLRDDNLQTEAAEFIRLTLECNKAVATTVLERLRTGRTEKKRVRLWKVSGKSATEALIYFCNGIIFEIFSIPIEFAAELADDLEEWNRLETAAPANREGSRSAPAKENPDSSPSRKSAKKVRIRRPAALAQLLGTLKLHVATERERARRRRAIGRLEEFLPRIPRVRRELQGITVDWIDLDALIEEEFDRAQAIEAEAAVLRVGAAGGDVKQETVTAVPQRSSESRQEPTHGAALAVACIHSDDFRSVIWCGEEYHFNASQAACVRILWDHYERGKLAVHQSTIGDAIGSTSDTFCLRYTFRTKKGKMHPAWGRMIELVENGCFRLSTPALRTETLKNLRRRP
jgi:hypothetical protein